MKGFITQSQTQKEFLHLNLIQCLLSYNVSRAAGFHRMLLSALDPHTVTHSLFSKGASEIKLWKIKVLLQAMWHCMFA